MPHVKASPSFSGHGSPRPSHTPQGVFSSFTGQTEVCPFTRAHGAFSFISQLMAHSSTHRPSENEIQPPAGRNPALGRSKSSLRSDEICVLRTQTMKPRNLFGFGASFTLAAIYSRGTCRPTTIDVLMFHFRVRNGTGWDHQAMTTRFQGASLCSARCLPR